jgi:hypothetical protein
MTGTRQENGVPGAELHRRLDEWTREGLLTTEQVDRILGYETSAQDTAAGDGRSTLAIEALAYLGGALTLAATLALVEVVWGDLSTVARLAIPLAATMLLLTAGLLVGRDDARPSSLLPRLRSALWLVGLGTWAAFLGVLGDQTLDLSSQRTWLLVGAGGVLLAAPLYQVCTAALQQVGLLGTCLSLAGAVGAQPDWHEPTLVGFGIWLVAVAWFGLGVRKRLPPPLVAQYSGAAALVIGAMLMGGALVGQLLALATLAALYLVGVRLNSLATLAVAALATLLIVPQTMSFFFPDHERIVAPIGLLLMGGVLVGSAVVVTRRRAGAHESGTEAPGKDEIGLQRSRD